MRKWQMKCLHACIYIQRRQPHVFHDGNDSLVVVEESLGFFFFFPISRHLTLDHAILLEMLVICSSCGYERIHLRFPLYPENKNKKRRKEAKRDIMQNAGSYVISRMLAKCSWVEQRPAVIGHLECRSSRLAKELLEGGQSSG